MFAIVHSGALVGVEALPVQAEMKSGLHGEPGIRLVGLPDVAVKESTERVTAALLNGGFSLSDTRTVINLAPGDIRKEGPIYDLPIALSILATSKQMDFSRLEKFVIAGELSLNGNVRPVRGGVSLARFDFAKKVGGRGGTRRRRSRFSCGNACGMREIFERRRGNRRTYFRKKSISTRRERFRGRFFRSQRTISGAPSRRSRRRWRA